MTTRWPCIVVAALGLLAVATSASAECAWVLWSHLTSPDNPAAPPEGSWQVVSASAACSAQEKDVCERVARESTQEWINKGGYHVYQRFVCLPDTVDPRGPKAK